MLQYSKVLRGREEWKAKAMTRGNENREYRKAINHYRHQIVALKAELKSLSNRPSEHSEKN